MQLQYHTFLIYLMRNQLENKVTIQITRQGALVVMHQELPC
jgi:hypothetical protein